MTVISLADYQPSERYDGVAWTKARIEGAPAAVGPWTPVGTEIVLDPTDTDPANPRTRNFTTAAALSTQVWFRVIFIDDDGNEQYTDPTPVGFSGFATVSDVEIRAGRELNNYEQGLASMVIRAVTGLIVGCVGRDYSWAVSLSPVPEIFKLIAIEKAWGAINNPQSVAVQSETLGDHTVTNTFGRSSNFGIAGLSLSPEERQAVEEAFFTLHTVTRGEVKSILTEVDENQLAFQPVWSTRYPDENGN